jgi:hypothetical protein
MNETDVSKWAKRHNLDRFPSELRAMISDALQLFGSSEPAAQRNPLTDKQIYAMCADFHSWSEWDGAGYQKMWLDLCRAIEDAHGIKEST